MEVTALVRYRRGVVGESKRTVHLVPITGSTLDVTQVPGVIEALCGLVFSPGEAEALPEISGMPCVDCMALAEPEVPAPETLPVGDPDVNRFTISGP